MQAEHVLMGGVSGHGKTTELRRMHETFDGVSVFCNFSVDGGEEGFAEGVAGATAASRSGMQDAVAQFASWNDVRVDLQITDPDECVETAMSFARDVSDTTTAAGNPVATQLVIDECHNVSSELYNSLLSEYRDRAVKAVLATQNPQMLERGDLINAPWWVWVGGWSQIHRGFMDYYDFPVDEMTAEKYHVHVLNRQFELVAETETDEAFGV